NRDGPSVCCFEQLTDFGEQPPSQFTNKKELTLAFLRVSLGQQILNEDTDLTSGWLLIFEFIDSNSLEANGTHLKKLAQSAAIGQSNSRQCRRIQNASPKRLRLKEDFIRAFDTTQPQPVSLRR